jgi:hypothetical protein
MPTISLRLFKDVWIFAIDDNKCQNGEYVSFEPEALADPAESSASASGSSPGHQAINKLYLG